MVLPPKPISETAPEPHASLCLPTEAVTSTMAPESVETILPASAKAVAGPSTGSKKRASKKRARAVAEVAENGEQSAGGGEAAPAKKRRGMEPGYRQKNYRPLCHEDGCANYVDECPYGGRHPKVSPTQQTIIVID